MDDDVETTQVAGIELIDVSSDDFTSSFVLNISDPHLATAAEAALSEANWRRTYDTTDNTFVITDDMNRRGRRIILVVDDAPGTCQAALSALLEGEIGGVASRSELDRLPVILMSSLGQVASIPMRVLRASTKLPQLEERQRKVLELLATGLSNTVIANRLHVSQATVKREVSELLQIFKATNRLELAMRGAEAGLIETTRPGNRNIARRTPPPSS